MPVWIQCARKGDSKLLTRDAVKSTDNVHALRVRVRDRARVRVKVDRLDFSRKSTVKSPILPRERQISMFLHLGPILNLFLIAPPRPQSTAPFDRPTWFSCKRVDLIIIIIIYCLQAYISSITEKGKFPQSNHGGFANIIMTANYLSLLITQRHLSKDHLQVGVGVKVHR